MNLNLQANLFVYEAKVGDFYFSGGDKVEVLKRTKKRIYYSNNVIVSIKTLPNGMIYLSSKSVVRKNRSYPVIGQMIRDIEGYLIYKNLTKNL
jgi:tRNA U34 5-carboxymethylaminomethyl modifying enzyme MnmG/GidA